MISLLKTLILSAMIGLPYGCFAQDFNGIKEMVARRLPFLKEHIVFQILKGESNETFILSTKGDKIIVQANSPSAASEGVTYYLNYYCHMSLSHCGNNIRPLKKIIRLRKPIKISTPFKYRYALNYCTYSYSYPFYTWEDFERELDWMALNGINLMLAPVGTEIVWQETLLKLGFSKEDVSEFIPGPAYTAWWLMGNLEGWGGPMSQEMIEDRYQLQLKILKRMKELGIKPVLQGFPGIVPSFFKSRYPSAQVVSQGLWGAFQRPDILLPGNDFFDKVAKEYYGCVKKFFGDDFQFFGGDLFHEGGNSQGVDLSKTARLVQQKMLEFFPQAKWVLQGWNNNPKPLLLSGLDKEHVLLINLSGEIAASWENSDEFGKTPWIWGSVNHFGGKTDMGGQLPVLINEPHRAYKKSAGHLLQGIGILPEGILSNPVVYDFALKTAWYKDTPDLDTLTRNYILYRYGKWSKDLYEAWKLLYSSVFGEFNIKGEGTFESIYCARPSLHVTSVSTWGPKRMQYDPKMLERALLFFRKAANDFLKSETYKYDLIDLARQVMANYGRVAYKKVIDAYNDKNKKELSAQSQRFIDLILLQDRLLQTDSHFLLGNWLKQAASYGSTDTDRKLSLLNARMQITYWGPNDSTTRVHDYANKEWAGLLKDYYAPRWKTFFERLQARLSSDKVETVDFFAMERKWALKTNAYPTEASGNYIEMVDHVIATTLTK
ncbi:alpha-N-acetylglucosaminidase [Prevotella sp. KH2C16]|nr:alpha-N-acetylglucosaminidase [Prevotella sp. KH2C16]